MLLSPHGVLLSLRIAKHPAAFSEQQFIFSTAVFQMSKDRLWPDPSEKLTKGFSNIELNKDMQGKDRMVKTVL